MEQHMLQSHGSQGVVVKTVTKAGMHQALPFILLTRSVWLYQA